MMRVLFFESTLSSAIFAGAAESCGHQEWNFVLPQVAGSCSRSGDQSGHDVDLVDAPAAGYSVRAVIDRIAAKNIEAVICDTSTPSILNDVSVIEALVAARPTLHVLMVGRHVSSLPKETLAMSASLQAVAIREYEYTVRDWLAARACGADLSAVDGLVWRRAETGEIVSNKPREAIKNLDELPFVSEVYRQFLHTPDYFSTGTRLWPLVVFDTSRGCPIIARSASIRRRSVGTRCATVRWRMWPTSLTSFPAKCRKSRRSCWKTILSSSASHALWSWPRN